LIVLESTTTIEKPRSFNFLDSLFGEGPRFCVEEKEAEKEEEEEQVSQDFIHMADWERVERVGDRLETNECLVVKYLGRSGSNFFNTRFLLVNEGRAIRVEYTPPPIFFDLNYSVVSVSGNCHAASRMQMSLDTASRIIVEEIHLPSEYSKINDEMSEWVKGDNGEDPQGVITAHIHLVKKIIKQPEVRSYKKPTIFINPSATGMDPAQNRV
jgi:hypothetical protein